VAASSPSLPRSPIRNGRESIDNREDIADSQLMSLSVPTSSRLIRSSRSLESWRADPKPVRGSVSVKTRGEHPGLIDGDVRGSRRARSRDSANGTSAGSEAKPESVLLL